MEKFLYISQPFLSCPQLEITCFAAMWTTGALDLKKKKIIFFPFFAFYLKTAYTSLIPGWLVLQAKRLKVINK